MFKNFEELQKYLKDQFEAMTASSATWSKGVQEISAETTDYSKKSIEASTAFFEKLLGAKTLESAVQIQTDYAKTFFEGFVAETTKLTDLYSGFAKEAFRPVESVFTANVTKPAETSFAKAAE